ncbi:MAG: glycosyltransferase [Thermoplasmataceae archaeon]|jgi:glycosyltransferase involved in cell wall biosynthesis
MPLISVIISAHDRKQYVLKAVESVLAQDIGRGNLEIIVVKNFQDEHIDEYLKQKGITSILTEEKFIARKMVTGARSSHGELIFFLDDDDLFLKNKISKVAEIFTSRQDVSMVHDNNSAIDDYGNPISTKAVVSFEEDLYLSSNSTPREFGKALTYRGDWYISCMSFRNDVFRSFEGDLWDIERSVDKFLFYMSLIRGKTVAILHDKLTCYRIHESLTTVKLSKKDFLINKSSFYNKSVETMRKIVESSNNQGMKLILSYGLFHADILARFFTPGKRIGFHDFFKLINYHRKLGNDASLSWALISLISAFSMNFARSIYYRNYRKTYLISQRSISR